MKQWVWRTWLACIAVCLGVTTNAEVPKNDLLLLMISEPEPALELLYQRDLDGAEALADKLIEAMPDHEVPYLLRSKIHLAKGDQASARADLKTAMAVSPKSLHLAYEAISFYVEIGELDAAKEVRAELAERQIRNFWAQLSDVHLAIGKGDLKTASDTLRASKLNAGRDRLLPRFAQAYTQTQARLGQAYLKQNDLWAAIAHLDAALREKPANAPVLAILLGKAMQADGRLEAAQKCYTGFPALINASAYPDLEKESQTRLAAVEQALADRAALQQRNEPLAKELVAIIDAYRQDPTNAAARSAAVKALWPYYDIDGEPSPGEMLLRIGETKPANVDEPEAVRVARESANALYRNRAGDLLYDDGPAADYTALRDRVLATYPQPMLLHRRAIEHLAAGAYDEAIEHAMLAEAVTFAEKYFDRKYLGTHIQNLQQTRTIARLASHGDDRSDMNDIQLALTEIYHAERGGDYVEGDRLRELLKNDLPSFQNNQLRIMLQWQGVAHRQQIEKRYAKAFDNAWKRGQIGILGRMTKRLVWKDIHDEHLAAQLMAYCLMNGDRTLVEPYLNQLLKRNPHNAHAWRAQAENAALNDRDTAALLYYNTAAQCINKSGNPQAYADILPEIQKALTTLEKDLGPDLAKAYWERTVAHETAYKNLPAPRWKPVIEASVMRVLQIAPDNAPLYNILAQYRADVGDHAGTIEASELGLKHDPERTGLYHYRVGQAYASLLPATTIHRDQLGANYLLSFQAYRKAFEAGTINELWMKSRFAMMYKDIGMIEEAIDAYRFAAKKTESIKTRAQAYFWLAKLQHEHNKAELPQVIKDLHAAINAYDAIPIPSYEESQNRGEANRILDELSGKGE